MSHFIGWQLIRLLHVFESVATQWVFTTVSLADLFCGCFCWALAPFAVCFAVLWMVRRKSGWGICVLPCVFCFGLCFGFMICHATCDHLCPCRSFLNYSFFSCKDRALEAVPEEKNDSGSFWSENFGGSLEGQRGNKGQPEY